MSILQIPQLWFIFGLGLNILGSIIIIYGSATKYFKSLLNKKAKKEIEDEAIALTTNRLAGKREDMLKDNFTLNFISNYKTAFWGFVFLILGFILQIIGYLI